jgi:hypothetical protein
MKPSVVMRFALLVIPLVFMGSCATSSPSTLGDALPAFQPFVGTWIKPSATRPYAEVLRIKSVAATGDVDCEFKVQRTDGYREYREFVHQDHVWIATADATARIEHGKPRIRLKFTPDNTRYPRFGWDSYDLWLPEDREDFIYALGKAGSRATIVTFDRE